MPSPRRVSRTFARARRSSHRPSGARRVWRGQGSARHDGSGRSLCRRRRSPRGGRRRFTGTARALAATEERTVVPALRRSSRPGLHLLGRGRRSCRARPRRHLPRVRPGKRTSRLVWWLGLGHRARLRWRALPRLPGRARTGHRLHGTLRRQCGARAWSSPLTSSLSLGGRTPHIMREFDARLAHSTPSNAVRIVLDRTSHFREKRTNAYLQARRQDHPLRTG